MGSRRPVAKEPASKRAFDVALAALGLVASSPLWALIALAIKLEDGGPVFYVRPRSGQDRRRGPAVTRALERRRQNGAPAVRLFRSLKFRSMVPDADHRFGPVQAGPEDLRVTRVGRLLRATAMDELPQLWNILIGEMSFVGPRALLPEEIEVRANGNGRAPIRRAVPIHEVPGYCLRHRVRPGLTGLAQIYADRDISRRHKFRYDALYVRRQSFVLDLKLIAVSFWITFRGRWERRGPKL